MRGLFFLLTLYLLAASAQGSVAPSYRVRDVALTHNPAGRNERIEQRQDSLTVLTTTYGMPVATGS